MDEVIAAGLTVDPLAHRKDSDSQDGREWRKLPYDRFRGRIMVPIRNENGVVVGFGGRVLDPTENDENDSEKDKRDGSSPMSPQSLAELAAKSSSSGMGRYTQKLVQDPKPAAVQAKYLNSPESLVFKKGSLLFGLDLAKKQIARCVMLQCTVWRAVLCAVCCLYVVLFHVLHCILLYCTVLYCTVLYCTVPHCCFILRDVLCSAVLCFVWELILFYSIDSPHLFSSFLPSPPLTPL
jgi:hypothetical protein